MAIKVILLLKRKQGMTPAAFREEYETGHSRLGLKLFGHLWTEYRRNYLGAANNFVNAIQAGGAVPSRGEVSRTAESPYDVVTELIFPDEAALQEMNRIASANAKIIADDELRLFDRENCVMTVCETLEEDLRPYKRGPSQ